MSSGDLQHAGTGERRHFATTQWSVVLAAADAGRQDSRGALVQLCETYWFPLYAYARRRLASPHEAQDLTQAFFAHLLEKQAIAKADPQRGRFRAFLLTAFRNFLANEAHKARAEKRGGSKPMLSLDFEAGESRLQLEPSHTLTAEKLYERRWVTTLLDQVLLELRGELERTGKPLHFDQLKPALSGDATQVDYERASEALGVTPAAAKQAAYRLRVRYRELLRAEVARTVADELEVDEELQRLFEVLAD